MDDDDIHDLIGAIYEAPLDPRQWKLVITRLKVATGSRHAHLWSGTIHDNVQDFVSSRHKYLAFDNDSVSFSDLQSIGSSVRDPTMTHPALRHHRQVQPWKALLDCELISRKEMKGSPIYNELMRHAGMFSMLMALLVRRGGNVDTINFYRSEDDPLYSENEKRLINLLVPHIGRSLEFHNKLQLVGARTTVLQNSLDTLASAIVLLNQYGKVVFLNSAAERLIKRCRDLYLRRDRLCARRHADSLRLQQLIQQVLGAGGKRPVGGSMAILGDSGAQPLQVMAAPVPMDGRASLVTGIGPVAMLVIHDPSSEAHVPQEVVSAMFGLTAAEARLLLALSNGQTLKEFCDTSHVTENTARTHLKSVFAKTGTKKQSDLVRLMSGLAHSVGMEQC